MTEPLTVTHRYAEPPARVFGAWTAPEQFAAWWGSAAVEVPLDTVQLDARVGGQWRADMVLPGGDRIHWAGEYTAVERPHRLELTMTDTPEAPERLAVTVTFAAVDGGTELTLSQPAAGFSAEQLERTAAGYRGFLEELARVLQRPDAQLRAVVEGMYRGYLAGDRAATDLLLEDGFTMFDSDAPDLLAGFADLNRARDARPAADPVAAAAAPRETELSVWDLTVRSEGGLVIGAYWLRIDLVSPEGAELPPLLSRTTAVVRTGATPQLVHLQEQDWAGPAPRQGERWFALDPAEIRA